MLPAVLPAVHATSGRPRSGIFWIVQRIADNYGARLAGIVYRAIGVLRNTIDMSVLESAVAGGNADAILAALGGRSFLELEYIVGDKTLAELLEVPSVAAGRASASVLEDFTGLGFSFNATDPNVVMYARRQSSRLIVQVADDVREGVRVVVSLGAARGLTVEQQARAIRNIVGLPPNWAAAPMNLGNELREGRFTSTRRLSAVDKAVIRKRLREGTITEDFIASMENKYARSLERARALTIARTESLDSSMHGLRTSWRQAAREGVLPETARRMYIVTPDDRLRPDHARVPALNPEGVGLDEPFQTPFGPLMGPPIAPNCRCGEGLLFSSGRIL